ncbi:MAG: RNA polymerase sigma factor [Chitinophagales bacterium]|nr:RNA polymerase sigma factor [Chitinophagales bacterium]MDW8394251.1 RNA polymerase sigma factor [Chitinophagales bacterium]
MRLNKTWQAADDELIRGCLRGEERCYRQLYERTAPTMFGVCLRYVSDYQEAEDVLQEGYLKVFRNLHQFRGEGSLLGWMRRIFINTALAALRKRMHLPDQVDADEHHEELPVSDVLSRLDAADLLQLIRRLPDGYRTVFNLHAIEGYSHQEIAELLHISTGTSKSQLARARYQLQKMVLDMHKLQPYAKAL